MKIRFVLGFTLLLCAGVSPAGWSQELLGLRLSTPPALVNIDVTTGVASNLRAIGLFESFVGIAFSPNGKLYGLTTLDDNSLYEIDVTTGIAQLIGETGLDDITEGDLCFHPRTGVLYALQQGPWGSPRDLFTVDLTTGLATTVGALPSADWSAMAFTMDGTLLAIDTNKDQLVTVNPADGSILATAPLSSSVTANAGMAVHPRTGTVYVADMTGTLFTLDTSTATLSAIGSNGLTIAGLTFVFQPEVFLDDFESGDTTAWAATLP